MSNNVFLGFLIFFIFNLFCINFQVEVILIIFMIMIFVIVILYLSIILNEWHQKELFYLYFNFKVLSLFGLIVCKEYYKLLNLKKKNLIFFYSVLEINFTFDAFVELVLFFWLDFWIFSKSIILKILFFLLEIKPVVVNKLWLRFMQITLLNLVIKGNEKHKFVLFDNF